jgi:hypothetical protein
MALPLFISKAAIDVSNLFVFVCVCACACACACACVCVSVLTRSLSIEWARGRTDLVTPNSACGWLLRNDACSASERWERICVGAATFVGTACRQGPLKRIIRLCEAISVIGGGCYSYFGRRLRQLPSSNDRSLLGGKSSMHRMVKWGIFRDF